MTDSQTKLIHAKIWDLISDYADIRDELENVLCDIRYIYEEIQFAIDEIGGELDAIEKHLSSTGCTLKRFRVTTSPDTHEQDTPF